MDHFISLEYGYRQGDEYHLIGVFTNYSRVTKATMLSYLPTDYFDIPRKELVIKNDCPMSCKIIDDLPEMLDIAANLFDMVDWKNEEYISYSVSRLGGVINGSIGKRMFINFWSELGSAHLMQSAICNTYGASGENDVISLYNSHDYHIVTDNVNQTMYDVSDNSITVRDGLRGDTYIHAHHQEPDIETEKYLLNDFEISKSEFESAEAVDHFNGIANFDSIMIDIYEDRLVYKCEHDFNEVTLADLFEIARIITE